MPTADSTGALVNTSASGPMPTSRYWLHAFCATSTSFTCCASAEPGFNWDRSVPTTPRHLGPDCRRQIRIAARALLDHPLQHRHGERHPSSLDDLQIDRARAAMVWSDRGCPAACWSAGPAARLPARHARRAAQRRDRQPSASWLAVGKFSVMSNTPSWRIATTEGLARSGRQIRPIRAAVGEIVRQNECGVCHDRHRGDPSRSYVCA